MAIAAATVAAAVHSEVETAVAFRVAAAAAVQVGAVAVVAAVRQEVVTLTVDGGNCK